MRPKGVAAAVEVARVVAAASKVVAAMDRKHRHQVLLVWVQSLRTWCLAPLWRSLRKSMTLERSETLHFNPYKRVSISVRNLQERTVGGSDVVFVGMLQMQGTITRDVVADVMKEVPELLVSLTALSSR